MRLSSIHVYPVKSLRGADASSVQVRPYGLAGDRRWIVVDADRKFVTIRECPAMLGVRAETSAEGLIFHVRGRRAFAVALPPAAAPTVMVRIWNDTVPAKLLEGDGGALLSEALGRPVALAHLADPTARPVEAAYGRAGDHVSFADAFPLLLASRASLMDLERRLGHSLAMERFRPNVVIEGGEPWAEDRWRRIRIGGVDFRVAKPCARCAIPTRDPETGAELADGEPLRALAAFHRGAGGKIMFGQNLIPDGGGALSVGDPVEIIEAGDSNVA